MKVLIFNTGSTSLRFKAIALKPDRLEDFDQYKTLASGIVRGIGAKDTVLKEQQNKQTIGQTAIAANNYTRLCNSHSGSNRNCQTHSNGF